MTAREKLTRIVAALRIEREPDDPDTPTCNRCGDTYELRHGYEPSPECDPCAHELLREVRQLLAAHETGAETRCRHSHIGRCVICGCESEMCCGPSGSISAPAPQPSSG